MSFDNFDMAENRLPLAFGNSNASRVFKASKKDFYRAQKEADDHFNKRWEIEGEYSLPGVETIFTESTWSIHELKALKIELNSTKSFLNNYDEVEWHEHSKRRHKGGKILWYLRKGYAEFLTQAWCKLWEIACTFPLIPQEAMELRKLRSMHLGEAPGAFVVALNHWLKNKAPDVDWDWLATSLNPYYEGNLPEETLMDDRVISRTEQKWFFGADNTGNVMLLANLDALVEKTKSESINLVTADGSINCSNVPEEQELMVSNLHYCETITALHLLCKGGNFLLKIFTIFEDRTVCLLYLLACCFEKIIINKPGMSREGNSEAYVICLKLKGKEFLLPYMSIFRDNFENLSTNSMFRLSDIDPSFLQQLIECSQFFNSHQCRTINNNIRTFKANDSHEDFMSKKTKHLAFDYFLANFAIKPLTEEQKMLGGKSMEALSRYEDFPKTASSYNSRKEMRELDPKKQLAVYARTFESIESPKNERTFKLTVVDVRHQMLVSTGKEYEKIENSKFCSNDALHMFNETVNLRTKIGFHGDLPSPSSVENFMKQIRPDQKVLTFEYTAKPDNNKLIQRVHETLKTMGKNQNLILLGYSMLSRLSVQLLYLLTRTFDSVEFEPNEKLGYIVNLVGHKQAEEVIKTLAEILDAWEEAKKKGHVVLSILPMVALSELNQLKDIRLVNHQIMKFCVHQIVSSDDE